MMVARRIRKMAMVALAGVALAVVSVPDALAQGGGRGGGMMGGLFGGQGQMYEPSVSSRDLDGFTQLFGLDAAQKDAVKTLFDAYQQQFSGAAKKVREEIDALTAEAREAGGDPTLFREIGEKRLGFQKSKAEMEKSFLADFKDVLTDDQATKWPKFERVRRRETTISRGLMSGERVNLFKLVEDLKLEPEQRAALEAVLDQYEMDLDRELIERNKMQEELQGKIRDLMSDPEAADELIKKGREVAVKVRDVNRKYAAQLETQLPSEKKPSFQTAFRRESFPQIYRETYYTRLVEAAGKLDGLDESQKAAITSLQDAYHRDLQTVQRDMEKAQEESEMNFSIAGMMGGGRRGGGNNNNNNAGGGNRRGMFGESEEMGELRTRRRELERGAEEKIKALLNEQQLEKLPTRGDEQQQERGGRGRDGANDDQPRRRGGGDNADRPQRRPGRDE